MYTFSINQPNLVHCLHSDFSVPGFPQFHVFCAFCLTKFFLLYILLMKGYNKNIKVQALHIELAFSSIRNVRHKVKQQFAW